MPDGLDRAARALAAHVAGRDLWDGMDPYLRQLWRDRVRLVLDEMGREETSG